MSGTLSIIFGGPALIARNCLAAFQELQTGLERGTHCVELSGSTAVVGLLQVTFQPVANATRPTLPTNHSRCIHFLGGNNRGLPW